jgi:demethylmenaquinone methyltransferase / 2-methoxy-6-polyprenyl-1,4-benzoquinol methylase
VTTDKAGYAQKLRLADVLREHVIRRAVRDLDLRTGDHVLDAGCGIGSHLPLLADEVGASGLIIGLDISDEFLSIAGQKVAELGLGSRVVLVRGDVNNMPFPDKSVDCVLSVDCVGYPFAGQPTALLKELKRVVKPGGTVAVMGWTHQLLLPGYPLLESKLNTASPLVIPSGTDVEAEDHFMRAAGWFQKAGFAETRVGSYVGDISFPLNDVEREAVRAFFEMLWGNSRQAVSADEWQLLLQLSGQGQAESILDRTDYYGFFVYTCFTGRA